MINLPRGVGQKTLRALRVLRKHQPLRPARFAKLVWPDSPYWKVHYNCGPYGSTTGMGLVLSAGSYLRKMERLGLTHVVGREMPWGWTDQWFISEKGRDLLKEVARRETMTDAKPG